MYVFVEITFDPSHLIETIKANFSKDDKIALMGTIQFAPAVSAAREALASAFPSMWIPQQKPLSPGEVLGCTSPRLPEEVTALVFVADGRLHLESAMIHNPTVRAFRYDPYGKRMTAESYDTAMMTRARGRAIERARHAKRWGVVVGTLGRQGNPRVVDRLRAALAKHSLPCIVVLLSEVFPAKLALMRDVEAWVQVCCPRLSVDWGAAFDGLAYHDEVDGASVKSDPPPLLAPYEAMVALGEAEWLPGGVYPMDFYSESGGAWSNYYRTPEEKTVEAEAKARARAERQRRRQELAAAKEAKVVYE
jgi:2-(3-amino-3-carboxypropyl)histidine synthase